jgi:dTDP-4-dehydrorhamnose reductase
VKVLVTGARGMLAHALIPVLEAAGHEVVGLGRGDADVSVPGALRHPVKTFKPDWIFHLAAWTRVDDCEADPDRAHTVNALGSRNAALAAAESGASLLAISSDYVFDGRAGRPYREHDATAPQSVYAASKWAGEQAVRELLPRHLVVRTSWLFGSGGHNFVDTVVKRARTGEGLRVVDDQRGSPTWTKDLSATLVKLAESAQYGTYHVSNSGDCTWWELAEYAVRRAGLSVPVEKTTTDTIARPAPRPVYSVLSNLMAEKVTGQRMPHWREAVDRYLESRNHTS